MRAVYDVRIALRGRVLWLLMALDWFCFFFLMCSIVQQNVGYIVHSVSACFNLFQTAQGWSLAMSCIMGFVSLTGLSHPACTVRSMSKLEVAWDILRHGPKKVADVLHSLNRKRDTSSWVKAVRFWLSQPRSLSSGDRSCAEWPLHIWPLPSRQSNRFDGRGFR